MRIQVGEENLYRNLFRFGVAIIIIATTYRVPFYRFVCPNVDDFRCSFPVASAWPAGDGLFPIPITILILFMTSSNCSAVELGNKLSAEGIRGTAASVLHLKLCKCWLGWWTGTMGWMSCGGWALSISLGFRWVVWGPQCQLNALANADFAWV